MGVAKKNNMRVMDLFITLVFSLLLLQQKDHPSCIFNMLKFKAKKQFISLLRISF